MEGESGRGVRNNTHHRPLCSSQSCFCLAEPAEPHPLCWVPHTRLPGTDLPTQTKLHACESTLSATCGNMLTKTTTLTMPVIMRPASLILVAGFGPNTVSAIARRFSPSAHYYVWDLDNKCIADNWLTIPGSPPFQSHLHHRPYLGKHIYRGIVNNHFARECRIHAMGYSYFRPRFEMWNNPFNDPPAERITLDSCKLVLYNCAPRPRSEAFLDMYAVRVDVFQRGLMNGLERCRNTGTAVPKFLLVTPTERMLKNGRLSSSAGRVETWGINARLKLPLHGHVEACMDAGGTEAVYAPELADILFDLYKS